MQYDELDRGNLAIKYDSNICVKKMNCTLCVNLAIVTCLVEQGADIHADTDFAIRWSARNGHSEVIRYLINLCTFVHIIRIKKFKSSI